MDEFSVREYLQELRMEAASARPLTAWRVRRHLQRSGYTRVQVLPRGRQHPMHGIAVILYVHQEGDMEGVVSALGKGGYTIKDRQPGRLLVMKF